MCCLWHDKPWFNEIIVKLRALESEACAAVLCCVAAHVKSFTYFNVLTMYSFLLNRLIATLMLCSLCLQGCRSNFRVTSEDFVLEKSCETSDNEQVTSRVLVPGVQPPDVPNSGLPVATLATLPSVAASTIQVALPIHYLAVESDTVSWQSSLTTESEEEEVVDTKSLQLPAAFGSQEWSRYFGEVGEAPRLPSDIHEILEGPCPFCPGKAVKDTHLLVLIPSTVDGQAFTLDLLGELIQTPRGDGHRTQYFLYEDEVQRSSRDGYASSSYWVLLTRDVLPGSRGKSYEVQRALIASQAPLIEHFPYTIPNVLEAATVILSHYVRSGDRLYEGYEGVAIGDELPSTSTRCTALLEDASEVQTPIAVGRFCSRGLVFLSGFDDDGEFGISCLCQIGTRNFRPSALLHAFGAEEWSQYFGEVGEAPRLPSDINEILGSPCPFWAGEVVKDTHLLVLIPATVAGEPFSLDLLERLVKNPKVGDRATEYDYYHINVRRRLGARSPESSYWILMTRDVLEGSRGETYAAQKALVAQHASRTGLPYELPGVLEVATAILSHYVRSGERLYTDALWTWTRCQELVNDRYPAIIGGFSDGGLGVYNYYADDRSFRGVSSLRKL